MQRWIVHVDMDAFFAAVEQRDNPALLGKPVIVGGLGRRGVVATASYEARHFGVHSALSMVEARRRCPHGVFLAGDHRKYGRVALEIQRILAEFSPLVEPLSLDEAFLDVTGMEWLYPDPEEIARRIKVQIKTELGLVVSAGVAANKFMAKLASDWGKPDGLVVVEPGSESEFLKDMPVSRLWGVGEKAAKSLQAVGINTIGQLACADRYLLDKIFGNSADHFRALSQGRDDRLVICEQAPKSIGNEVTFEQDMYKPEDIRACLLALAQKVGRRLRKSGYAGRTVNVKLRFASFKTITRARTLSEATCLDETIYETVGDIIPSLPLPEGVRLLGVTVSGLQAWGGGQMTLFSEVADKRTKVSAAVDGLKDRFGDAIVTRGRLLVPRPEAPGGEKG
ncbi:MAG: DNA polymerase IV [Negativicutes bacterium]|nr:DNA polymerase IV [Negativicutes bacterium]